MLKRMAAAIASSIRGQDTRTPPAVDPPSVRGVDFGDFRRLAPVSTNWGFDRGRPIDRYYIEDFLERHAGDIRGRVLEIGDNAYTRRFGGDRVTTSDVLHVRERRPGVTLVADLTAAPEIASESFDCVILTQTLQLIFDIPAALRTLHRILAPAGALLATVPGITKIVVDEGGDRQWWTFASPTARRLLGDVFGPNVAVESHGNVLAAIAFLHGLSVEELQPAELDHRDPAYEVIVTVRAVKPCAA